MLINRLYIIAAALMLAIGGHAQSEADIVILGDSNIWLAGDSCNNHIGWTAWAKDIMQPHTFRSYARSGASWSHTSATRADTDEDIAILGDNNVIYNQVLRLRDAYHSGEQPYPTLILISAGGNDAWFADKRPDEFGETVAMAFAPDDAAMLSKRPNEVLSLAGAIRYDCLLLRQTFADVPIVLLTPPQMVKVEPRMLTRVSDIIDATAVNLDVPVLRLDIHGPISRDVELKEHVNTYDGVHTNEAGAERLATHIVESLRTLFDH